MLVATPSIVVVGHVTKDLVADGYNLGGGVTFAALAARALGYAPRVLTRACPSVGAALAAILPGAEVRRLESKLTTTFRNTYVDGRREQHLATVAEPIEAADVPSHWRPAPLVLLAPVAGEIPAGVVQAFPKAMLGLAAQGWLRGREPNGAVHFAPWRHSPAFLARADVVVFSEEDVGGDMALVAEYASRTKVLALTRGARGATIFSGGVTFEVPAFPVNELEPTGAGDVFATALLIAYNETRDLPAAARFASCAASFVVQRLGSAGIPTRSQVIARLNAAATVVGDAE